MPRGMRKPETVKLDLPDGNWILLKKWLTARETRELFGRMMKTLPDGSRGDEIDPLNVGIAKAVVYLLDWSITDADDQPLVIRDAPPELVWDILNDLDHATFRDVIQAVEAHEDQTDREREDEKKTRTGAATLLQT